MNPQKKQRLLQLKEELTKFNDSLPNKEVLSVLEKIVSEKYQDVVSQVKNDSSIQYLDGINLKLDRFKKKFDLKPILEELDEFRGGMSQMQESVLAQFKDLDDRSNLTRSELESLIKSTKDELSKMTGKEIKAVLTKIESLENQLSFQDSDSQSQKKNLSDVLKGFESKFNDVSKKFEDSAKISGETNKSYDERFSKADITVKEIGDELNSLRQEIVSKLAMRGGGSMNRNIAIGGNTSVLSRYTDINIKPGSNVTLSYQNNDTTKYLDLTISSSGGGGSVTGIVRSLNRVSTSQTMGDTTGTDYVYIATAGVALTLPTAVGNQNLYTIKNVAASSVLIATTGGETIDGSTDLVLSTQFTSVDLINDGNDDWSIT